MRAAVLGSPVTHSLSPVLHRAGYAAAGLTGWEYERYDVDVAALPGFVAALDPTWRGLSLTMPLKVAALELATTVSEVARRAGAANTLVRREDGGWDATNTDVVGVVEALAPRLAGTPERALVLGAGATARSCVLALAELGVRTLTVRARDTGRAADLLAWALDAGIGLRNGSVAALDPWATTRDDVVVSTVPPDGGAVVAATVPPEHPGVLLDVVYANWPTPLARAAAAAGMTVVPGLDMLVHQAAAQFTLVTGTAAPVAAMAAAGREAAGMLG
ncbi:shikimate dehydrogenase [Phycicoccus endophyticus]|uniref:Shikimate dehydrogenase n=1 Tax=Phycicoccus endophyticus TaxID=1690220 RepID=A0A7G9R5P4_9MICO|nr:shikimate dehydrogenase [Phycicoccus endophyticus]QNN50919.1 shikimate dehydrogenase [Phycicoccus endophyticus]